MFNNTKRQLIFISSIIINDSYTSNTTISEVDPNIELSTLRKTDPINLPLYIIGVIYMFIGIAIVCDELFFPSLELIVVTSKLSNDVVGTTLIITWACAPELFTCFIGTFIKNDLGFSTILGSSVFNLLYGIATYVIFAPKPLKLT